MALASPTADSIAVRHVLLPAIAPLAIVGLYVTPVSLIGCANRGLLALVVASVSTAAAFVTVATAFRARMRGDRSSIWWTVSTLVLTLPLVLLLGPLG
jgi:ABC-type amino acid transport system permease subunit